MISQIIAMGIGFAPGSVGFIVTLGFAFGTTPAVTGDGGLIIDLRRRRGR